MFTGKSEADATYGFLVIAVTIFAVNRRVCCRFSRSTHDTHLRGLAPGTSSRSACLLAITVRNLIECPQQVSIGIIGSVLAEPMLCTQRPRAFLIDRGLLVAATPPMSQSLSDEAGGVHLSVHLSVYCDLREGMTWQPLPSHYEEGMTWQPLPSQYAGGTAG